MATRAAGLPRIGREHPACLALLTAGAACGPPDDLDDPAAFARLPAGDRIHVLWWIRHVLEPARRNGRANSYALKHVYERTTGVYLVNGAFKGAMRAAGYAPVDPAAQNWVFRYRAKWRILLNQRPRRAA